MTYTFDDYLADVEEKLAMSPGLRLGQTYFNVLFDRRPDIASEIAGTVIDPFYSDAIIPEFIEEVEHRWSPAFDFRGRPSAATK
jgi:hypothetical protein